MKRDDKSVTIRFSKNKACRYALKDLDCPFLLVTLTPVKPCGVAIDQAAESVSFGEDIPGKVRSFVGNNVAIEWGDGGWTDHYPAPVPTASTNPNETQLTK